MNRLTVTTLAASLEVESHENKTVVNIISCDLNCLLNCHRTNFYFVCTCTSMLITMYSSKIFSLKMTVFRSHVQYNVMSISQ